MRRWLKRYAWPRLAGASRSSSKAVTQTRSLAESSLDTSRYPPDSCPSRVSTWAACWMSLWPSVGTIGSMAWLRTRTGPPRTANWAKCRRYTSQVSFSTLPSAPVVLGKSLSLVSSFSSSKRTKGSGRAGPRNWQSVRSKGMAWASYPLSGTSIRTPSGMTSGSARAWRLSRIAVRWR